MYKFGRIGAKRGYNGRARRTRKICRRFIKNRQYSVGKLNASILITRGEKGMSLFEKGSDVIHIPTKAKEVYDVTGAGDAVVAALTLALASGATMKEAAVIANHAAGITVGKMGTSAASIAELKESLENE